MMSMWLTLVEAFPNGIFRLSDTTINEGNENNINHNKKSNSNSVVVDIYTHYSVSKVIPNPILAPILTLIQWYLSTFRRMQHCPSTDG